MKLSASILIIFLFFCMSCKMTTDESDSVQTSERVVEETVEDNTNHLVIPDGAYKNILINERKLGTAIRKQFENLFEGTFEIDNISIVDNLYGSEVFADVITVGISQAVFDREIMTISFDVSNIVSSKYHVQCKLSSVSISTLLNIHDCQAVHQDVTIPLIEISMSDIAVNDEYGWVKKAN